MSSIAIITARGGSKRIPKKNIKEFCGKPIISYSIEAAIKSGLFDEVMVSTDSEEIADIAKEYGAKVPFMRSEKTSGDFATTYDVLLEVINRYRDDNIEFDTMCCIYPTAPFLTGEILKDAYSELKKKNADGVMPVVKYDFPPQRAVVIRDGLLRYQYPEYMSTRSQDLEPVYHDCGQFYICKTNNFVAEKKLFVKNIVPYLMDERNVQDIDNPSDWIQAEMKFKILKGMV